MPQFILFLTLFFTLSTFAKTTHDGTYYVPSEDGKISPSSFFDSQVEFEGTSLIEASEFTVVFPKTLVGIENRFVIKKINGSWEGDSELFDNVDCGVDDQFDFSCELNFNKERVIDVTKKDFNQIQKAALSLLQLGNPIAIESLIDQTNFPTDLPSPALLIDRNLARENMLSLFSLPEVNKRLESTDIFINEPIGFFNYNINYITPK